jgi:hypothetical protein
MNTNLRPSVESYLIDWGITLAIGGAFFLVIGCLIGWIIWKNSRTFAEQVEEGNRNAFSDYEKTSDEISRIKSELSGSVE